MSLKWDDKTLSAFYENTKKAMLKLDGRIKEVSERSESSFGVSDEEIRGIVARYIEGNETPEAKSLISQIADKITLEVTDGSKTGTASIVLSVNGRQAGRGTIDLSGLVIFNSFLNDSKTMIDGGKIETDTLFARDIKATSSFQVNNGVYAIEQNTNGVTLKNVREDSTQVSSVTLSNGAMNLSSLLITLMAYYRGHTGKIVVDDVAVSILATSDGTWGDAYSYGIDVNDLGINMTHCPAIGEQTVYSYGPNDVNLSAGWTNVISFMVTPGTYVVSGCIRFSQQTGNSFSTKITMNDGVDCNESINSVYCSDSAYYSSNSTAIVTLSSSGYIRLTVYSKSAITGYGATLKAVKIHG